MANLFAAEKPIRLETALAGDQSAVASHDDGMQQPVRVNALCQGCDVAEIAPVPLADDNLVDDAPVIHWRASSAARSR